jgi:hypothetical protein
MLIGSSVLFVAIFIAEKAIKDFHFNRCRFGILLYFACLFFISISIFSPDRSGNPPDFLSGDCNEYHEASLLAGLD